MRRSVIHFGKHKGAPFGELGTDYLEFCLYQFDRLLPIAAEPIIQELLERGRSILTEAIPSHAAKALAARLIT